jgi:toxin ParE1/3/4
MGRYTVASEARDDIRDIYRYVAERNRTAARRLRSMFFEKFRMLARHPLMGEARDDLAPGVRMFVAEKYVILYRPTSRGIAVVQVVHSARDIHAVMRRPMNE